MSKNNSTSSSSSSNQVNYNNSSGNSSNNENILEKTGLHLAIENNYIEIVQLLLAHKKNWCKQKSKQFIKF